MKLNIICIVLSLCSSQMVNNPGIKVRLDQDSLNVAKVVSQKYLPDIVNFDLNLPDQMTKYMFNKNVKF